MDTRGGRWIKVEEGGGRLSKMVDGGSWRMWNYAVEKGEGSWKTAEEGGER